MLPRTPRPLALGVSVAVGAASLLMAGTAPASAAAPPSVVSLIATAYGSTVNVSPVTSGQTANFSACSSTPGSTYGNTLEKLDLGTLAQTGTLTTSGVRTGDSMTVTSTVSQVSLLKGLISATEIKATSQSGFASGAVQSSGSASLSNFKISGLPATAPTAPNSTLTVAGVKLTFNKQTTTVLGPMTKLTVDALRVDIPKTNTLGLAAGSIVLGEATSGSNTPTNFAASGQAYGTYASVGSTLLSGQTALTYMGCGGSDSNNKVVGVTLPGVLSSGTVTSTARAAEGDGTTTATFSNSVTNVNLLNGLVTADAITAKSSTTKSQTDLTSSTDGTQLVNLVVDGQAISASTADNTKITVAGGLATVTVRKVVKQSTGQDVTGLELKVLKDGPLAKSGTLIQVAVAKSRVA